MKFKKSDIFYGLIYAVVLLVCFSVAIHYATINTRLALAWLLAGIVASQVAIDLARFSSPESKAKFSAIYRASGVVIAVVASYLLK